MHLENGEIVHDGSLDDRKLYMKALEWGSFPGEPAYPYRRLSGTMPEGYFNEALEGVDAILRGLVRLAFSQSIYKSPAIAHLAKFSEQAIEQSRTGSQPI